MRPRAVAEPRVPPGAVDELGGVRDDDHHHDEHHHLEP
jgi:hypothetical protein